MPENSGVANSAPDQFGQRELTYAEASAFCGPVAAMALFKALHGASPTVTQVREWAKEVGWTPEAGMAGVRSQQALLKKGGVDSEAREGNVSAGDIAAAVKFAPVNISTDKHYFVADDYDENSRKFHVGVSQITALKGGAEWMTYDEISHAAGASGVNGILIPKYDPTSDPDISGWPSEVTNVESSTAPIIEQNVKDVKSRQDAVAAKITEFEAARTAAGTELATATSKYVALTGNANQKIADLMAAGAGEADAYAEMAKKYGVLLETASREKTQAQQNVQIAEANLKEARADENKLATEYRDWQMKLASAKDVTQQSLENRLKYYTTMVTQGKMTGDMAQAAWSQELEKAKMGTDALIQGYSTLQKLAPQMGNQGMADAVVSSLRGWSKFTGNDLPQGFNLPIIPLGDIMAEFKSQAPAWSQARMNAAQGKMDAAVAGMPDWREAFKTPTTRDKNYDSAIKAIADAENSRGRQAALASGKIQGRIEDTFPQGGYPGPVGPTFQRSLEDPSQSVAPGNRAYPGLQNPASAVGGIPAAYDPNIGTPESYGANDYKAGMATPAAPRGPQGPYQGRGIGPGVNMPGAVPTAPPAAPTAAPGTGDPVSSFKSRWQGRITRDNTEDVRQDFEATFPTQKPIDLITWILTEQTKAGAEAPQQ